VDPSCPSHFHASHLQKRFITWKRERFERGFQLTSSYEVITPPPHSEAAAGGVSGCSLLIGLCHTTTPLSMIFAFGVNRSWGLQVAVLAAALRLNVQGLPQVAAAPGTNALNTAGWSTQ
jgi:hypothetical protein